MTPEKLFHELLGLGLNWEVVESRFERESGTVFLELRETPRLWDSTRCPTDGGEVFCYDHTESLMWRHLNVFQHPCQITCRLPRGKCRQCGQVFRVRPPWEGLSMHFTKEFEAFALLLMREMPVSKVADMVGESDTRLWRMLFRQVDAAYAEADFSQVCCVGVDEMSVRKGHEYISVFADLMAKRVIFATDGKDRETWARFVEALEKHNGHRHAITQASMDMSQAYQRGVAENCRNAQVVFDKFHVINNVGEAVDKVRRAEVRLGGQGVWEALQKSRWLWRKNPEHLTGQEPERLAKIQDKNMGTAKAYQMRLVLQDIYRSATTGQGNADPSPPELPQVANPPTTGSMREDLRRDVVNHLVASALWREIDSVCRASGADPRLARGPRELWHPDIAPTERGPPPLKIRLSKPI